MKLVLFDIDGTLLSSEGAGMRAMRGALSELFGTIGDPAYRYDGKTDRQIVRDLMRGHGHHDEYIDQRMDELLDLYLRGLAREVESGERVPRTLPGIPELLDALESKGHVTLGLLTGNIEPGAKVKLAAAGVDVQRFRVNAFGSDHEHRLELPGVAQRRAAAFLGRELAGDAIYVIGDTPADIRCGEAIGARAIGVATGHYPVEELKKHEPYAVFENLAETSAVVRVILDA
ncbi:MAG: haloacid dehalogenase-like hydrolase [Gemmatimonadaceae bacterium]|nr:haloacid dehalogenase-like hydrolase [Gemmatimonadaceae bacterium]